MQALGDDRRKLSQALIETAARLRATEKRIAETEARLEPLDARAGDIRSTLAERRAVIAEVLAALQRIGRSPPPALVIKPEDALSAVRSAIALGGVVPEMRAQVNALAADLAELARLRSDIEDEQSRLRRDMAALDEERQRVTALGEERQRRQAEAEQALDAARQKAVALGRQADNLTELIAKAEQGLDAAARAAREAERAEAERAEPGRQKLAALPDMGRLAPAVAFAEAQGHLPLPVNGVRIREFGAADKLGGTERGLTIATRSGAQVTSPCDGWIVYAGTFRNYGQVLIVNAGGGYHVVLAGMERVSVNVGQFVLTGEPVAVMGGGAQAAANLTPGAVQPNLYVEFRKDGAPIDPGPWWATSEGEKARG